MSHHHAGPEVYYPAAGAQIAGRGKVYKDSQEKLSRQTETEAAARTHEHPFSQSRMLSAQYT